MKNTTLELVDDKSVEIGVKEERRAEVAKSLSTFLASTYTLYMKTLYYHWNVTGSNFSSLHALFEDQYNDLHDAGDKIAERIRMLGHFTPGTFSEYMELSYISEDKKLPENSTKMVENLLKDNETCSLQARKVMKTAEAAEDEVTVDMMVDRMSTHDEAAWMLRSLIQ
ncbi:Dps family protein [Sneathiella glossodoripedis]|uniref:Dps family protein n=1 Tax=Sneathiella glossodoripedis TaxID=418853 RepID=UPI000471429E|nr:DNA starvation/stationary phase protection protein [Sneathiella glossodoripedis]